MQAKIFLPVINDERQLVKRQKDWLAKASVEKRSKSPPKKGPKDTVFEKRFRGGQMGKKVADINFLLGGQIMFVPRKEVGIGTLQGPYISAEYGKPQSIEAAN